MTGVFALVVLKNFIPSVREHNDTSFSVETASLGYRTVLFGKLLNKAISSRPICEAPSSPIDTPACEPQNAMWDFDIAAILSWSWALVRKAAKVETKGEKSLASRPRDIETIFCSAIKHSIN